MAKKLYKPTRTDAFFLFQTDFIIRFSFLSILLPVRILQLALEQNILNTILETSLFKNNEFFVCLKITAFCFCYTVKARSRK